MSEASTTVQHAAAFQLKGSLFPLTILQLFTVDIERIAAELDVLIKKTPNFFRNTPIIIDLKLVAGHPVDYHHLNKMLRGYNVIPLGVRHGDETQQQEALEFGLPILNHARNEGHQTASEHTTRAPKEQNTNPSAFNLTQQNPSGSQHHVKHHFGSKFIAQNVRSGQQIYAPGGDLIVLGSVSHGAELLADGNVHVYGALRGRALAGIQGNKAAHIFCLKCEAELISIAGIYRVKEDVPSIEIPTHIFLDRDRIVINPV